MSVKSAMTAIADKIRALLGISGNMGLDGMSANLTTMQDHIASAYGAVRNNGGEVPSSQVSGNLASAINSIPTATAPVLQNKSVSPSTSAQTVKPDSGYDGLSQVTVSAMPTATQATPGITVSNAGLITASATQSAGYVSAGTKSATRQLTTQAAKTITPDKSQQTAVESGRYTTGAVTVNPIPESYKEMRFAEGTARADRYGELTINCGFRPDYLFLFGDAYYSEEDDCWYEPVVGIPLIDMNATEASMPESMMYWGEDLLAVYPFEVTSTSVTAALWFIGWDWDYTQAGNVEVRYRAVKFQ